MDLAAVGHCRMSSKMSAGTSAAGVPTTEIEPFPDHPGRACEVPPFSDIYQKYFDFVWTSARSLGVGPDAIDDVVQEVFIVIHARLHTLKDPAALRSWIYGIVRRTACAQFRAQRARNASTLDYEDTTDSSGLPTPFDLADQSDQARLLWRLLAEIEEPKREVFVMAEIGEMTTPEIAQALDIPLGTAYSRLRAGRQAFEAALARHNTRQTRGGGS
jgi:RNA polymerase sigma-70 factor, ECF subfamily